MPPSAQSKGIRIRDYTVGTSTSCTSEHVVQFYDTESILISEVGRAMGIALDQGAAVVCIATDAHRELLERHLMDRGIDVSAARTASQFVCLDAPATLPAIVKNGVPDVIRFAEVVGAVIDQAAARFPRVWIFGELVALMCADGHHAGAVELEKLWTSFTASRPQVLLHCAYPTSAFRLVDDMQAFVDICEEHCRVLHSDSSLVIAGSTT
jgi:hypothetical protein